MNNFLEAKGIEYKYNVRQWREWIAGAEKGDVEGEPAPKLPHIIGIGNILWVKGPIVEALKEAEQKGIGKWQKAIKATHIGTSADGLHKQGAFGAWTDFDWFVALPSTTAKGLWVELKMDTKTAGVPVGDLGPWNGGVQVHKVTRKKVNTDDPYWVTGRRPQAESGRDKAGRKTNKAGIDISTPLFRALKLSGHPKIDWRIVPKPEDGQPYIVLKGQVIKHKNRPWVFGR